MKTQTKWFFIGLVGILVLSRLVFALPTAPSTITPISNSTANTTLKNMSMDAKGTISVITISANQQDYKWKAYVGNVTGKVALDDVNGKSIYDWDMGATGNGKVLVSRFSTINWATVSCANQTSVDNEQTGVSMLSSADDINRTFNSTNHRSFLVGTTNMTGCRSTATYINDAQQTMGPSASFQEALLMDTSTSNLIYTTLITPSTIGYDGASRYDFQLLVAENESATVPTTYYFWVELG